MTRVLVTGSTGFVGNQIVEDLIRAEFLPRLLVRDPRTPSNKHAEIHRGNILDRSSLESGCAGVDAIIHLVGIISEAGDQTFENIHVKGTANVLAAAQKAGIRRIVHMSALGTRPNSVSCYHQTKWLAEESVRSSGLETTIFRPSLIFGPRDHFVNLFAKIIRFSPVVPIIGNPHSRFQPVAVQTVSQAFVRALSKPDSKNQTYELCGPEILSLPQMIDAILAALNRKRLKIRIPNGIARLQAALLEFLYARIVGTPPPLNRDQLIMLGEDNMGDATIPLREFGVKNPVFSKEIRSYLQRSTKRWKNLTNSD